MATSKKTSVITQDELAEPVTVQGRKGVTPIDVNLVNDPVNVILQNTNIVTDPSPEMTNSDEWKDIVKNRAEKYGFSALKKLLDEIFRQSATGLTSSKGIDPKETDVRLTQNQVQEIKNRPLITITGSYDLLKAAVQKFVSRVFDTDEGVSSGSYTVPGNAYLKLIADRINEFFLNDIQGDFVRSRPIMLELIWNYWHEEGMLVQTMHAIARRFQNISNGGIDPLANMETDPLRPLNNILWGYIQDAQHRLTIKRRSLEYEHEYGLKLIGKAVDNISPADRRSEFLYVFHDLLNKCSIFFKEKDDRTRDPDGFPVLHALKSVHLTLSEGAHNQFGDLPITARVEMLIEQWILSQPEIREFLGGRVMVPYRETWMDRVDTMKNLQGWPATSISYYNDLARFGEQLLLHIRWTSWTQIDDPDFAALWANDWRAVIQGYIHAYNVVTNVNLSADAATTDKARYKMLPSYLIQQKYQQQKIGKR